MLTKTLRLEAIQFDEGGRVDVRLQKRIALDGEVLKEEWHRTEVPPGVSAEQQMAAVNDHLGREGFTPLANADIAKVAAAVVSHHTPEVVAKYRAAQAEIEAQLAAEAAAQAGAEASAA